MVFEAVDWSDERKSRRLERVYKYGDSSYFCDRVDPITETVHREGGYDIFDSGFVKFETPQEELACQHMI